MVNSFSKLRKSDHGLNTIIATKLSLLKLGQINSTLHV